MTRVTNSINFKHLFNSMEGVLKGDTELLPLKSID